jgi:hypothetical protein
MEPIKVFAMALENTMGLPNGQIMLGLENYKIPLDAGLYIALLYGTPTVIGNSKSYDVDSQGNFYQVQETATLHQIDLDMMSFDASARVRQQEVLFAVTSDYALSLMDANTMRFNTTPGSFVPIPSIEETKELNRFRVSFNVNALHRKVTPTPYYTTLQPVALVENP